MNALAPQGGVQPWAWVEQLRDQITDLQTDLAASVAREEGLQSKLDQIASREARLHVVTLQEALGLQRRAAQLLGALYEAAGGLVTHRVLIGTLWPPREIPDHAVACLRVYVLDIRALLGPDTVCTVRGEGYLLNKDGIARVESIVHPPEVVAASGSGVI